MHESGTGQAFIATLHVFPYLNLLFRVVAACSSPSYIVRRPFGRWSLVIEYGCSSHPRETGKVVFLGIKDKGQRELLKVS